MRKPRTLDAIIYHQRCAAHHAAYARFYLEAYRGLFNKEWLDRAVYHQEQAAAMSGIARRLMDSVC